jgi:hypothetical protein
MRLSPLAAFNVLRPESHTQERVAQQPNGVEAAWWSHWLEFVLPLLVVSAASAIVLLSIAFKIQNLNLADLFEGWILAFPMRWVGATPDPKWITEFPQTFFPYPPQYPWLVKVLGGWFPHLHPLLLGRAVSTVAGAGTAVLIVVAVLRERRTMVDAWLAGLVFLTAPLVSQFWWQSRVDPLSVFWTMAAYSVAALPQGPILSAACIVAGSLAKQTVALHALPLGLWFLWTTPRPFKRFWRFIAAGTVLALAVWPPILFAYGGFFWQASVLFHTAKQTRPWYAFVIIYRYLPSAFMGAAIAAATRGVMTRPWSHSLADRWWLGFSFALVVDSLLLVKDGSYAHYALTIVAFGAVLIGCFAREMVGISKRAAPACLAVFSIVAAFPMFMGLRGQDWRPFPSTRQAAVDALLRTEPTHPVSVLSDGNALPFVLGAGRMAVPVVADSFALKVLEEANRLNLTPLHQAIREGRIPFVLLDRTLEAHQALVGTADQLWPKSVLEDLAATYEETGGVPGLHVYRPRR